MKPEHSISIIVASFALMGVIITALATTTLKGIARPICIIFLLILGSIVIYLLYRLIRPSNGENTKGSKARNLTQDLSIGAKKHKFGTWGDKQIEYSEVTQPQWDEIAKLGKDDDGLVVLRFSMRSMYSGRVLTHYYVEAEYANLSLAPRHRIIFPLFPLALNSDAKGDGLAQKVELINTDEVEEVPQRKSAAGLIHTFQTQDLKELKYSFKNGGIIPGSGSRVLKLKVTPIYANPVQALSVSPDMGYAAYNRAARKVVMQATFSADCLPINRRHWITRLHTLYDPEERDNEKSIDLKGNTCTATYYGVYKQNFLYGMIWEWPT